MDIRKKIKAAFDGLIFPTLLDTVYTCYQEDVDAGAFTVEETDYATAAEVLSQALSAEEKELLTATEYMYEEQRGYAVKYGFSAGLAYGFAQCVHSPEHAFMDFRHTINKGLLENPGMQRHLDFHEACEKILANLKVFEDSLSEEMYEHIVSISCAWDQRIYSAARDAFYTGYQAAYCFMEQLRPTISMHNIGQILELEFKLGYTDAYYRREARYTNGDEA